jgi:hypothetical protein
MLASKSGCQNSIDAIAGDPSFSDPYTHFAQSGYRLALEQS